MVHRVHRGFARRWLVAQALEHGDLNAALVQARQPGFVPWTTWVADTIEARQGHAGRWATLRRRASYLLSTHRWTTSRYLASLEETNLIEANLSVPAPTGDVSVDALSLHRLVLDRSPASPAAIPTRRAVCSAWDAATTTGALEAHFARRLLALGGPQSPKALCERLLADVERDLTAFTAEVEVALTPLDGSVLGEQVVAHVREQELVAIEAIATAISARVRDERVLAMHDEWLEFASLRAAAERSVRRLSPSVRRYYAERLFSVGTNWACHLYNSYKERPLGSALFGWLHTFCFCAGAIAIANADLAERNARCQWY